MEKNWKDEWRSSPQMVNVYRSLLVEVHFSLSFLRISRLTTRSPTLFPILNFLQTFTTLFGRYFKIYFFYNLAMSSFATGRLNTLSC